MRKSPSTPLIFFRSHWLALIAGLWMTACVQSPQAAVPAPTVAPVAMAWDAGSVGCAGGERLRNAVAGARRELQAQGLALWASCKADGGALVVQVNVVDGLRASKVVRGPLAEGEPVDMGTPAGASGVTAGDRTAQLSPDVRYNRQWLRALMARHQFDNLPDAWWHFAHKAAPQPTDADVDLAAN